MRTHKDMPGQHEIRFVGLSQTDAKRKALNFWYMNKGKLHMSIREFSERLSLLADGKTIVFDARPTRARRS